MIAVSVILLVGGGVFLIYGFLQNSSLEAQFLSMLGSGRLNPGTPFMIAGGIALVLGVILLVLASKKKNAVPFNPGNSASQSDKTQQ